MFSLIHPGKQRWWKSQMIPLLLFFPECSSQRVSIIRAFISGPLSSCGPWSKDGLGMLINPFIGIHIHHIAIESIPILGWMTIT